MVTILDCAIAAGAKPDTEGRYTEQSLRDVGFPLFGGCSDCQASLAAFNMHPTRTGFVKCKDCVGDIGFATVDEFNAFPESEDDAIEPVPTPLINVRIDTDEMMLELVVKPRPLARDEVVLDDDEDGICFAFGTVIAYNADWRVNTEKIQRLKRWFNAQSTGVYFVEKRGELPKIQFTGSGSGIRDIKLGDGQNIRDLKAS